MKSEAVRSIDFASIVHASNHHSLGNAGCHNCDIGGEYGGNDYSHKHAFPNEWYGNLITFLAHFD